jgi:chromosome segregation ATPase
MTEHTSHPSADKAPAPAHAPAHNDAEITDQQLNDAELQDIKQTVIDSGDLANRAALLATAATTDLRTVTQQVALSMAKQQKQALMLFGIAGGLMVIAASIFGAMAFSLSGRVKQLDTMVTVVGKRVGDLDSSMELVGSVNEALQELVGKQEGIAAAQSKMDGRLDEMAKKAEELAAKEAEKPAEKPKTGPADPALAKQVQSLDGRLQAQAAALKSIASHLQSIQGSVGDAGGLRKEMEAVAKMQRERQASENAAAAAATAAQKQREKMVQFPRASSNDAPLASPNAMGTAK